MATSFIGMPAVLVRVVVAVAEFDRPISREPPLAAYAAAPPPVRTTAARKPDGPQ